MISFVVRTRDEEQWVGHTIQSIIDYFGPNSEIIVVDNESVDDTLEIVNLFARRFHNIKVYTMKRSDYTPGKSLNFGISKTSSESKIVGIISSHCQIKDIDLDLLNQYFKDEKCAAVFGKQIPVYRGKKIRMRYIWDNFNVDNPVNNPLENIEIERYFFHNAFSFVRKTHVQDIPFDEDLSGKEDRYWAEKVVKAGKHYTLDPRIVCLHHWTDKGATWSGIG